MIKKLICLLLSLSICPLLAFKKVHYSFSDSPIDVVIPCHPKDAPHLERCIEGIKKYVAGFRRIIVVSEKRLTNSAEWCSEQFYPFTKQSIIYQAFQSEELSRKYVEQSPRIAGWIYQQFLKLFAAYYIPNVSSNILIVDSDVVFLKPVSFLQKNGAGLYAVGDQYYAPYFKHAAAILPGLKKFNRVASGIAHHMLFQREVLDDLYKLIYNKHRCEPWMAIARALSLTPNSTQCELPISEYEIYFNFVFARTNQVKIRHLRWCDTIEANFLNASTNYDYVAIHVYDI